MAKCITMRRPPLSLPPSCRYLINFLLDASLGMLLIYAGVRAVSAVVEWRQWDSLRFGEYGEGPPRLLYQQCPVEGVGGHRLRCCNVPACSTQVSLGPCLTVCVSVCVGEPVQCSAWVGQCALYILIMMFEKVVIMLVLLIPQWKKVGSDIPVQT